jgi:hypothetical protein
VLEQGLHADAEVLIVAVDGGPVLGLAAHAGAADPGQDGRDDVVAEGDLDADRSHWRALAAASHRRGVSEYQSGDTLSPIDDHLDTGYITTVIARQVQHGIRDILRHARIAERHRRPGHLIKIRQIFLTTSGQSA